MATRRTKKKTKKKTVLDLARKPEPKHEWPFEFELRHRQDGSLLAKAEVHEDGTIVLKQYSKSPVQGPKSALQTALQNVASATVQCDESVYNEKRTALKAYFDGNGKVKEKATRGNDEPPKLTAEERKFWDQVVFGGSDENDVMMMTPWGPKSYYGRSDVRKIVEQADSLIRARRLRHRRR